MICGMGDGSIQAISKQIDAANLFFLITKNGSDPFFIERMIAQATPMPPVAVPGHGPAAKVGVKGGKG